MSAGKSPHMSRQGRSSQGMSAQIKSHVFAECQIRDRFRRLSHIDLFSHCLALLLPDSLSVWASESLKLSHCYVLTLPSPRGIFLLALSGCDRS